MTISKSDNNDHDNMKRDIIKHDNIKRRNIKSFRSLTCATGTNDENME